MIQAAWDNILEDGSVSVTSEASGFPAYRLYDRLFQRPWRASGTATQTILVDQGASPDAIDTLIVPAGHLLAGCTISWQYSADNFGSDVHDAVTSWVQSGIGEIRKQMSAPGTNRYWRLVISGATVAPEAGEVVMTLLRAFDAPLYGGKTSWEARAVRVDGMGGPPRFVLNGQSIRVYDFSGKTSDPVQQSRYETWFAHWAEHRRPFYLVDQAGRTGWFEFVSDPSITGVEAARISVSMQLKQIC